MTKFTHSKAGGSGQLYGLLSAIAVSAGLQYSYIFTAHVLNVLLRCLVWDSKCRFFYTLSLPIEPIVIATMEDMGGNSDFFVSLFTLQYHIEIVSFFQNQRQIAIFCCKFESL